MMLLTAPAITGYLPEPFPAAAERLVRQIVPVDTTITIRHDYPYWTGSGSVPVMHITVADPATGVNRSAIPNAPQNPWRLKDVRDFAEYTAALIRDGRELLNRKQQQAQQREEAD